MADGPVNGNLNASITSLKIRMNNNGETNIFLMQLNFPWVDLFSANRTLQTVNLSGNQYCLLANDSLALMLRNSHTLVELDLSNCFSNEGAVKLPVISNRIGFPLELPLFYQSFTIEHPIISNCFLFPLPQINPCYLILCYDLKKQWSTFGQEVIMKALPDKMYLKSEKCLHGNEGKVTHRLTGFATVNAEGDTLLYPCL